MQLDERCVGERMYRLGVGVRRRTEGGTREGKGVCKATAEAIFRSLLI